MFRVRLLALVVIALLVTAAGLRLAAAGDKPAFISGWRTGEIRVDGVDEEWRAFLQAVKGQHFSVAFLNDDEALYFCLVTADRNAISQIGTMGFVLWLEPAGGTKKGFGVRYRGSYGPRVDVLGPGDKDVAAVDNGTSGIVARIGGDANLLVYELKIPLRKSANTPDAPDVDAGAAMQVRLETPEWRGPLPPVGRGGRVQVGVGAAGPHGGVFYPGPNTTLLKPVEVDASLRLAAMPSSPAR
jgi:hypothetical protein